MPDVSPAEVQRRVSQQGNDIDSLYELVAGADQKPDTLTAEFRAQRVSTDARLGEILDALRHR